ncbi:MAG: HEAT repeat domain-containing protein [Methanomicrobiales archaeon]|nr:HEAT repeat domain-containing protein [Methanomicrobiales archaeon]
MSSPYFSRPVILAGILLGCTILGLYVGLLLHISIVYTHLFYLPIVLGGLWYPRKSLLPATYLAILYIAIEYGSTGDIGIAVLARAGSFLFVAAVIGLIAGRIQREDQASLAYLSSYAQRLYTPRTRIQSTFDGVRMSLGMDMNVERMREQGDVTGLIRALDHQNPDVRYQAADALGSLHDPGAVERLARALKDPDCGVRWKAAEALGRMGIAALPSLLTALRNPSSDIRWRAVLALGDTGEAEAIPALITALNDADRFVRGRAILVLSGFGERATGPLNEALKEKDPRIRVGAIRALARSGKPVTDSLLELLKTVTEEPLLSEIEDTLVDMGEVTVEALSRVLEESKYSRARVIACRVLGRLRNHQAFLSLTRALEDRDDNVRECARTALLMFPGEIRSGSISK